MPSDEELRKVAEDVRALARSLARDVWEASQSARRSGRPAGDAFRHGVRDAAYGARSEFQRSMRRHWYGWGGGPWWGRGGHWSGWGSVPPGGYGPPGPPGTGPEGRPGTGPGPGGGDQNRPGFPGPPGPAIPTGSWGPYPWGRHGAGGYGRSYPARHRRRGPLPPVRQRWDAPILAALLVVVFGTAWLVGGLGLIHLSVEAVLAVGLMLLGAALVVTGRTDWSLSRHAWPVVLGVLLVVGLFATSSSFGVAGALANISAGTTSSAPSGNRTVYGGLGQLNLDLSNVAPGSTIKVETIAGETFIKKLPEGPVVVESRILAGQICVQGQRAAGGIGASSGPITLNPDPVERPVTVEVHQLAGQIVVGPNGCHHP